jgi:hypothetical protein
MTMARLTHPYRRTMTAVAALTALGGVAGAWQLLTGVATPPDEDLPPGLGSWVLPALWLLASVAVPMAVTAWLAWRRSLHAPAAALVASAALGVELAVQVPFVGFDALQVVFGAVALLLAGLAADARRQGWRPAGPLVPAEPCPPALTAAPPADHGGSVRARTLEEP